ncbi:MAG: hypothetical protein KDB35_23850 [Acidimicrobiales bacterium]|nr:hypothetical protein [Acidimicrobiales bacterium]
MSEVDAARAALADDMPSVRRSVLQPLIEAALRAVEVADVGPDESWREADTEIDLWSLRRACLALCIGAVILDRDLSTESLPAAVAAQIADPQRAAIAEDAVRAVIVHALGTELGLAPRYPEDPHDLHQGFVDAITVIVSLIADRVGVPVAHLMSLFFDGVDGARQPQV